MDNNSNSIDIDEEILIDKRDNKKYKSSNDTKSSLSACLSQNPKEL
jgi:hypothetical protein